MKRIYLTMISLVVMVTALSLTSCSKSDDNNEELIPAGTYIEENGHESELFSFVASGNTVRWTCTVYGKVDSVIDYTYTIKDGKITMVSKNGTQTAYYNRNGNRVTIGEITYIKQWMRTNLTSWAQSILCS